jgi:cell wall-associated NlpC family hydrolase
MSLFVLTLSSLFYINQPNAVMREKPCDDSEVVSCAYYSEKVDVLEDSGEWFKIQTAIDKYPGWVKKTAVHITEKELFTSQGQRVAKVTRNAAHLYDRKDTTYGAIHTLPFESRLEVLDSSDVRWVKVLGVDGREGYIQHGDVTFDRKSCTKAEMLALSKQFLHIPYTWGGRSSSGYDCSGYTQMLYRQMGVFLPRDSKDQLAHDGFVETTRDKLVAGDLIFWGLAEDKIRHVGMYLGNDEFIHATVRENQPWIRISVLSAPDWNGEKGHPFRAFRTPK